MIDWSARARSHLAHPSAKRTAKTDESLVMSVSSASGVNGTPDCKEVSAVLSAATAEVRRNEGSAVDASAIASTNVSNRATVEPSQSRSSGNPYMSPEQTDECHVGGWGDAEIATFTARVKWLIAIGRPDAEHLAERLSLRDRQGDDRRLCVECRELGAAGRCAAARRGAVVGADRRMEPVQSTLMRCPSFTGPPRGHRSA